MTTLLVAFESELLVLRDRGGRGEGRTHLHRTSPCCIAADPSRPRRAYCGTFREGLRTSDDGGKSWRRAGPGIGPAGVTAVHVGAAGPGGSVVYAGTEPSAVFRSDRGGAGWRREERGLDRRSVWGAAVDPRDPDAVVVSAAHRRPSPGGRFQAATATPCSTRVPSTSRNLASQAGWAGQAGAVTKCPSASA